ncbi:Biotin carboxyl carrier protein of Propionyl-CoA carboxylase (plasmid) [Sinorhizobium sojae CCBAU 05684]|uniref:Biotin carboxyl carrier protein of Propionyl-CoA carboxylase n=1 Tax=Sinorhizobium sojae CCBAU 05684 TaxID=716928 RepID=A0A249PHU7_9HYPH|nr:hypothetical protein [Sinorhizobium sojae]ASY65376.1 Biotin carboxyl carrier protein of Propionyl-CoA carboxylase [Sinorhizobium sojae CCBAU 05684]
MSHAPKPEMTPEAARRDHWQMLRYMAVNALYGALVGAAVAGALIWLNIGAVGTHIVRSTNPLLATAIVIIPFALLFGGAVAASSIALLPYRRRFRR